MSFSIATFKIIYPAVQNNTKAVCTYQDYQTTLDVYLRIKKSNEVIK